MHTGMLWFDGTKDKTLLLKIIEAATYYRKKYGRSPDLVLIHPSLLDGDHQLEKKEGHLVALFFYPAEVPDPREVHAAGPQHQSTTIYVRPYRPVLPGHIWVGIEDKN